MVIKTTHICNHSDHSDHIYQFYELFFQKLSIKKPNYFIV